MREKSLVFGGTMSNSMEIASPYKFEITKILFKSGNQIQPGRINIFVGANNCGKTRLLKEIFEFTIGDIGNKILLKWVSLSKPKTWKELTGVCYFEIVNTSSGQAIRHKFPASRKHPALEHFGYDLESEIDSILQNQSSWDYLRKRLGGSLVMYLNTDNRLNLIKSRQSNNNPEVPESLLEALYRSDSDKTKILNDYCWKFFRKKVFLSPYTGVKVEMKIGNDFADLPSNPQDARDKLNTVPGLDDQGDGMRSVIGIIAALCAVKKPIILLDEPEAFLHPPQAMQLGEAINNLINSSQQLFVATHSADFLRGLLSKTQDVNIIHIERAIDDKVTISILDAPTLKQIITDPLLSSSRVLDGLFYKGVVVTEGDADATFYQRAFQMIGAADEIHFINAHNKQTLKKVITPYQKLGIKFALVADADVLREKHDMEEILQITDDAALKERVLKQIENVLDYFKVKSSLAVMLELRKEILLFVSSGLMTETLNQENSNAALFELRKKLKELRDETDDLRDFKRRGRCALDEKHQAYFDSLWKDCASIGFFIVPVGELESWLVDYGVARKSNKAKWITEALQKLNEIEFDKNKELWKFINKLQEYFVS